MDDLGFDVSLAVTWFSHEREEPFALVRASEDGVNAWVDALAVPLRRCYITDRRLDERTEKLGVAEREILGAVLPDPGSTMAGDFGEVLTYFYHAAREHPRSAFGPKKWRLKQDRTKSAPHSDVIQFVLPSWPVASTRDVLLCSEVKTKATRGVFSPIQAAIADSRKDRTSRLARTLVWLRERALLDELGNITIAHLDRFIKATDYPTAKKRFYAVAVVCACLAEGELADAPAEAPAHCSLVVISVPQLQHIYTMLFEAARQSLAEPASAEHERGDP